MKVVIFRGTPEEKLALFVNSDAFVCLVACQLADGNSFLEVKRAIRDFLADTQVSWVSTPEYTGFPSKVSEWIWKYRQTIAKCVLEKKTMPLPHFRPEDFVSVRSLPLTAAELDLIDAWVKRRPQVKRYLGDMRVYFQSVAPGDRKRAIERLLKGDMATFRQLFEGGILPEEPPEYASATSEASSETEVVAKVSSAEEAGSEAETEPVDRWAEDALVEECNLLTNKLQTLPKGARNEFYKLLGMERPPRGNAGFADLFARFRTFFRAASVANKAKFATLSPSVWLCEVIADAVR